MAWLSAFERTPLEQLLAENRTTVDRFRLALGGSRLLPPEADDVWLLRYALSFKGRDVEAIQAAQRALEWRKAHADLVKAAKERSPPPGLRTEELAIVTTMLVSDFHQASDFGDPIFVIRGGVSNPQVLMDSLSAEKVELWLSYLSECAWQYCEAATRKRGYFVKQISLQDLAHAAMSRERRFFAVLGRNSKTNEWLRPQLLGRMIMFNAPSWLNFAFRIASTFMSKSTISKVWLHTSPVGPRIGTLCPYAQQLLGGPDELPSFLGGTCTCQEHGGCILGMSNSASVPRSREEVQNYAGTLQWLPSVDGTLDVDRNSMAPLPRVQPSVEADVAGAASSEPLCCRRCRKKRRSPMVATADAS